MDRRLLAVVVGALVLGAPAGVLSALCAGNACAAPAKETRVPFCSLPQDLRQLVAAGFREARSPHVLAVAGEAPVGGGTAVPGTPWPSADQDDRVPIVFSGAGVRPDAPVAAGTRLDAIAGTVAEAIGLRRPDPGVRSGRPVAGIASGEPVRLVLEVVWKSVGSADLERRPRDWPVLRRLARDGAATLRGRVGSLPLDPAAVLTTIGAGGLPSEHGITGTLLRDEEGAVARAWDRGAPPSVIATLGDHLDELREQRPRIGLVATDVSDRGVIGRNWYLDGDRDDIVLEADPERAITEAERLLATGYGADEIPDLLAVVVEGPAGRLDAGLERLIEAANSAAGGSALVVVTATGSAAPPGPTTIAGSVIEDAVEDAVGADVIEAVAPGGLFLNQQALTASGLTDDRVVRALRDVRGPNGARVIVDAFPAIAVTFARYCG